MEIKINHGETMVITLKGRLDTVTSAEFSNALKQEKIEENLVIIDFTDVEYISSAGLRVLLALKYELEEQGKMLEIHNINAVVREIFKVTGFINALTVK